MFRFGIVTREQLLAASGRTRGVQPAIAFPLVAAFERPLSDGDERALARVYSGIPGGPGIKMTWRSRLGALDDLIVAEIGKRFSKERPLRIHDMAASNAITSVALFERLQDRPGLRFLASDYFDCLQVVTLPRRRWRVVFDAAGEPLQFIRGRVVLSTAGERKRFPVNRLMHRWVSGGTLGRARAMLVEGKAERIPLFHPEALALAGRDARFRLGREDIFAPTRAEHDVVRLLSLLSSYRFSAEEVRRGLLAVGPTVAEGGLFAIGRTQQRTDHVDGAIFAKENGRFVTVAEIGSGYEFTEMVLGLG
jgi:hypothetical protein